jgi:hypothetical protein
MGALILTDTRYKHTALLSPQVIHGLARAELTTTLKNCSSNVVIFRGAWKQLTVKTQHALGMWAAQHPQRMCGLIEADAPSFPDFGAGESPCSASDVLLVDPTCNILIRRGRELKCSEADVVSILADPSALAAIAITGHGAECYIQFGSGWISTDPEPRLPGPIISPDAIRAPLVFLNACSCLRLGDSFVPRRYSMADRLYRRGTTVVGAFRNIQTSVDTARLFAEGITAGAPVGEVVNRLNADVLSRQALIPPFQVLGVPQRRVLPARVPYTYARSKQDNSAALALAEQIPWLEQLHHTISNWFEPSARLTQSFLELKRVARPLFELCHPEIANLLAPAEISILVESATDAVVNHRRNILLELQQKIQTGRWLESYYGSVSNPRRSRCASRRGDLAPTMVHRYEPFNTTTHAVTRLDCCARGTLAEWMGLRPARRPKIQAGTDDVVIDAPRLKDSQIGAIFIHRTSEVDSQAWPPRGGRISIPVADIPFQGRVTVVASFIGERSLCFYYSTLFVSRPRGLVSTAGSAASAGPSNGPVRAPRRR